MTVQDLRSQAGLYYESYPSHDSNILKLVICTLPLPYYKTGIQTRVKNARHCKWYGQRKNKVGLG